MNKIVVGNLKTYMDLCDVADYLKEMDILDTSSVVICPSNIYVPYFLNHKYNVGLQDISVYDKGIHTGEVLAKQASSMGIKYSIIGHSERRKLESLQDINKKIISCNIYGITSILCVGEEKESRKTKKIIKQYLDECLKNTLLNKVIIAYEPIWAVGNDMTPSFKQINETVLFIKDYIKKIYNDDIKVIYGGSVSKENIHIIKKIESIDGILVGNASSNSSEFKEIISKYFN